MVRVTVLRFVRTVATVALALAAGGPARAELLTGDPSADGWTAGPNSLQNGFYIRGAANFSYDMFRTAYTVTAGSPLAAMANPWAAGDRVLAMGGAMVPTTASAAGWPAITGATVNSNLAANVRIVSKFTSSGSAWSASSTAPGAGTGSGSHANGDGGLGAVLISTNAGQVTTAGAGILSVPVNANQWNGTVGSNGPPINTQSSRVIYGVDASGRLRSWELLLNTTLLASANTGLPTPTDAGRWNQALQSGTSSTLITDGLLPAGETVVPTPAAGLLLGFGAAGIGLGRRLRTHG